MAALPRLASPTVVASASRSGQCLSFPLMKTPPPVGMLISTQSRVAHEPDGSGRISLPPIAQGRWAMVTATTTDRASQCKNRPTDYDSVPPNGVICNLGKRLVRNLGGGPRYRMILSDERPQV